MYLIKTPWLLKKLYPQLIWNMNSEHRVIYLTFDDGPIPVVTPFVLETLRKYNAKATFFCIGDNVSKHPDIYQQLIADGHAVGNHTYNHLKGWKTDDDTYVQNFKKAAALISTSLFRPPYGRIKRSQIRQLKALQPDVRIIMWDVLSGDFDTALKPTDCLKGVLKYTSNGAIVVFHDSLKAFERLEYVLPRALEEWTKAGFEFAIL